MELDGINLNSTNITVSVVAKNKVTIYDLWLERVHEISNNVTLVFKRDNLLTRQLTQSGKLMSFRINFNSPDGIRATSMTYGQASCLGQDQLRAFESELKSDITLGVRSNETSTEFVQFRALKGQLSMHSNVFNDRLSRNSTIEELVIEGQDGEAMKSMVAFMYSGQLTLTDFSSALNLYKAAHSYNVSKVIEYTRQHMLYTMRPKHLVEALEFAVNVSDVVLRDGVNQIKYYSWDNVDELLNYGDLKNDQAIVRTAITFMATNIDKDNVFGSLELGDVRNDDQLTNAALDFIVSEKSPPLRSMRGFRELSIDLKLMINEALVKRHNR